MSSKKKVSVSLDTELVAALDIISKRLALSRSSLLNLMLSEVVVKLSHLINDLPDTPAEHEARRFKGKSIAIINDEYRKLALSLDGGWSDLFDLEGNPK